MPHPMRRRALRALVVLGGIGTFACSSSPRDEALDQARLAYDRAARSMDVQKYDPVDLQQAQQMLARAEAAARGDADRNTTDHLAYLAARQAQFAESTARARAMQQQIDAATAERGQIQLAARQQETVAARQQAAAAEQRATQLEQQLAALAARQNDQGAVLTLSDVLFKVGGAELQPGAFSQIDKIASYLKEHPDRTVVVNGFTDNTGGAAYNQQLSELRADAVRNALIARGVAASRITAEGLGESSPRAPNDTAAGRQLNRRVEVAISGSGGGATAAGGPQVNPHAGALGAGSSTPQTNR